MTTCHIYQILTEACLKVLRIYGPLTTAHVIGKVNLLRRESQLAFPLNKENVPRVLDQLQTDGEIEYVGGLWRTM